MLNEGDLAPDIHLLTDAGQPFKLADVRGKKAVLYFYPKASTSG